MIVHDHVEVVRHDADTQDAKLRVEKLCAGEPLEDGLVGLVIWAQEASRLMASSCELVVLAGYLASERASHEGGREQGACRP